MHAPALARQMPPTGILFLHSYDSTYQWTRDLEQGAREVLAVLEPAPEVRVEYLDARHETRADIRERFAAWLAAKYARPPRVVVASDDAAVEFLLTHPGLFPEVPVVFGGVNSAALAARLPRSRFAGVTEPTDVNHLIDRILAVRRGTRRVFVVTDRQEASIELRTAIEAAAREHASLSLTYLSGDVLSFRQVLAALERDTQPDDLVVVRPFVEDRDGTPVDAADGLRRVIGASRAPVVSPSVSDIGQGLLAGIYSTGIEHGHRMGQKALAVVRGTPVSRVGIEPAIDDQLIFDAQQLRRWGLREQDLPPGSRVANLPPSFYRTNKKVIWTGVAVLVLQTGIIAALILMARSRRRAQRALQEQADALAASNRQLDLANRSLVREQEGRQVAEEALRQSQKMEALGRLAGGVAHDFNNLLTVIIGQSALLAEKLPAGGALRAGADEIRTASDRAAVLTRQLLAFSRKQVAPRTPCRIAATLRQLEPIIRRLVPETVTLDIRADDDIPAVILGEGQFEQVVLNLVTNARDAMPEGGRLVIEARLEAVASTLLGDPDLQPGTYAVLRVTDTGVGMDAETQRQIFEPFFTTKEPGRGTGVGLATVYGIVKQHGGGITVNSSPAMGATFAIYLPAPQGAAVTAGADTRAAS
ncbi:hypothetical protein TBR22_A33240 [Luteitalea sp. TBR-22]|nr:hypothetical protein TBR22_A33240 [Luteitalea sp. TBR-22]